MPVIGVPEVYALLQTFMTGVVFPGLGRQFEEIGFRDDYVPARGCCVGEYRKVVRFKALDGSCALEIVYTTVDRDIFCKVMVWLWVYTVGSVDFLARPLCSRRQPIIMLGFTYRPSFGNQPLTDMPTCTVEASWPDFWNRDAWPHFWFGIPCEVGLAQVVLERQSESGGGLTIPQHQAERMLIWFRACVERGTTFEGSL